MCITFLLKYVTLLWGDCGPLSPSRLCQGWLYFGCQSECHSKTGVTFLLHWISLICQGYLAALGWRLSWKGWHPGYGQEPWTLGYPLAFRLSLHKCSNTKIMEVHSNLDSDINYLSFPIFLKSIWGRTKKLRLFEGSSVRKTEMLEDAGILGWLSVSTWRWT